MDWAALYQTGVQLKLPLDHQLRRHDDLGFESSGASGSLSFVKADDSSNPESVLQTLLQAQGVPGGVAKTALLRSGTQVRYVQDKGLLLAGVKAPDGKLFALTFGYQENDQAMRLPDMDIRALL